MSEGRGIDEDAGSSAVLQRQPSELPPSELQRQPSSGAVSWVDPTGGHLERLFEGALSGCVTGARLRLPFAAQCEARAVRFVRALPRGLSHS